MNVYVFIRNVSRVFDRIGSYMACGRDPTLDMGDDN